METAEQERQFRDEWSKAAKESKGKALKQQLLTSAKFRGRRVLNSASSFGVLLQGGGLIAASIGRKIEHSTQALQVAIDAAHTAPSSQAARGLLGEAYQRLSSALIEGTASQEQILAEARQQGKLINPSFWNHAVGFDRTYGRVWRGLNAAKDWLSGIETPGGGVGAGGGVPLPEAGDRSVDVTNDMHLPPNWTAGITHEGGHSFVHVFDDRGIARVVVPDAGGLTTEGMIRIADERVAEIQTSTAPMGEGGAPKAPETALSQQPAGRSSKQPGIFGPESDMHSGDAASDTETPQAGSPPPAPGAGIEDKPGVSVDVTTGKPPEIAWETEFRKGDSILERLQEFHRVNASSLGYVEGKTSLADWANLESTRRLVADYLADGNNPDSSLYKHLGEDDRQWLNEVWQKLGSPKTNDRADIGAELGKHHASAFNEILKKLDNLVHPGQTLGIERDTEGHITNIYVQNEKGEAVFGHIPERVSRAESPVADVVGADRSVLRREIIWQDHVDDKGVLTRTSHFSATDFDRFMDRPDTARSHLSNGWTIDLTADDHGVPEHAIIKNAMGKQVTILSNDQWDDSSIATHEFTRYINDELGRMSGRTTSHEASAAISAEHLRGGKSSVIEEGSRGSKSDQGSESASVQEKAAPTVSQVEVPKPSPDIYDVMLASGDKGGKTLSIVKEFHNKFSDALRELPQLRGDNDKNPIRDGVVNYLRLCGDSRNRYYDPEVASLWNRVISGGIDTSSKEALVEGLKHLSDEEARFITDGFIPDFVNEKRVPFGVDLSKGPDVPYADARHTPNFPVEAEPPKAPIPPVDIVEGTSGPRVTEAPPSAEVPPSVDIVTGTTGTRVAEVSPPPDIVVGTGVEMANEVAVPKAVIPPAPDVVVGTSQTQVAEGTASPRIIEEPLNDEVSVSTQGEKVVAEPGTGLPSIESDPFSAGQRLSKRGALPPLGIEKPLDVVVPTSGGRVAEPDGNVVSSTRGEEVMGEPPEMVVGTKGEEAFENIVTVQGEEVVELAKKNK